MILFDSSKPLIVGKSKGPKMPKLMKKFRSSNPEVIYDPRKNEYALEAKTPWGAVRGVMGQLPRKKKK